MPTTAGGTTYTVTQTTLPMGDRAQYGVADSHRADPAVPLILYCHGDGGGFDNFLTTSAWTGFRDWLIDNGYAWVESAGGGASTWGSPTATTSYEQAVQWVAGQLTINKIVVLGRSMGGLPAYWLYAKSTVVAPYRAGLIISSGVTDLHFRYYNYATDSKKATMRQAYGAVDDADWDAKTVGRDPMLYPVTLWDGAKVLQLVGTADDNVVPAANAYAIRALWAGHPAVDLLSVKQGGDHSAANGTFTDVAPMTSFLIQTTGVGSAGAAAPTDAFVVNTLYRMGADRGLYTVTLATA